MSSCVIVVYSERRLALLQTKDEGDKVMKGGKNTRKILDSSFSKDGSPVRDSARML